MAHIIPLNELKTCLKVIRQASGLTTREMADAIGIKHTAYYRAETGENISVLNYISICEWIARKSSPHNE